jgi:hypothetical protein
MNEKVYCVNNFWDMTIIEGIALYNNKKYYFKNIFDDESNDWTDTYNLTLLDEDIFKTAIKNWEYWKKWLRQTVIPHPFEYAEKRKIMTAEKIFSEINADNGLMELTENYYQNEIRIEHYLKNNKPIYKAKGTFFGNINGIGKIEVKWENVIRII